MRDSRDSVKSVYADRELLSYLGEYFYICLKDIPLKIRLNMMDKFNLASQNSFNSWQKIIPGTHDNFIAGQKCDNKKLSVICKSVHQNICAVLAPKSSVDNINRSFDILGGITKITKEQLLSYLTPPPIHFNLFCCLYDQLYNREWLQNTNKELLLYRTGYSDIYPKLTIEELAKKLKKTEAALYAAEDKLYRKISLFISKFKTIQSRLCCDKFFGLNQDKVFISAESITKFKQLESVEHFNPCFIVKVLSLIYNYEIIPLTINGLENYLLIKPGLVDIKQLTPLLQELESLIENHKIKNGNNNLSDIITWLLNIISSYL
jgi:hypothetical protein